MIDYEEEWLIQLFFRWHCKITCRALFYAVLAAAIAVILNLKHKEYQEVLETIGMTSITDSFDTKKTQTWLALTGMLVLLLDFRTREAFARFWEGTSLLHQMRGEWFDSISCCVTWSMLAVGARPKEVALFRHTIVRLMSLCHGSALEEIGDEQAVGSLDMLDLRGIDEPTILHLQICKEQYGFNKVETVLHIIYTLIVKAHDDKILKIPPPIVTRVYQTLSRGYVSLQNAKKIHDTRFPFPYAQLISGLLLLHLFAVPIMLGMLIRSAIWGGIFSFMVVFYLFHVNFIASELEDPFGCDRNDLPLSKFQEGMNNSLVMLLHGRSDHVSSLSTECIRDFRCLVKSMDFAPTVTEGQKRLKSDIFWDSALDRNPESSREEGSGPDTTPPISMRLQGELALRKLQRSAGKFNRTLANLARTLEEQVREMRQNFDTVKRLCCEPARPPNSLSLAQMLAGAMHGKGCFLFGT